MKKIIIHCGPAKTGSSAIQAFLAKNRLQLLKLGYFYPEHAMDDNMVSSGNCQSILSTNKSFQWKFDAEKAAKVMKIFETSESHTLLLSSEYFYQNIREIVRKIPTAKYIVYLRHPLTSFESNYKQRIKRGMETKKLNEYGDRGSVSWKILNDYSELSRDIDLVVRPYAFDGFFAYSVVSDFLKVARIPIEYKRVDDLNINPSYTLEALELKRVLNHFPIQEIDSQIDIFLQSIRFGTSRYSLISKSEFKDVNSRFRKLLWSTFKQEKFTTRIGLLALGYLQNRNLFKKQLVADEDLHRLVIHMKQQNLELYYKVREVILSNGQTALPYEGVYRYFDPSGG